MERFGDIFDVWIGSTVFLECFLLPRKKKVDEGKGREKKIENRHSKFTSILEMVFFSSLEVVVGSAQTSSSIVIAR